MSLIDVENAKQIRDPMDVLIKMEVPEDVDVTYSNYSTNMKIGDAELGERSWPMRKLADLQGDGFYLDGMSMLYEPMIASETNGKLGIRGDVGQTVSITVTGDSTIQGLSIAATGTNAVKFNGHTAALSDGQVIIPVGASSITIEMDASKSDERVEVSLVVPGTSIRATNSTIVSCLVSLRSDLSLEGQTLPESELNVEIYNDVDISDVVATIPDESLITYSCGYVNDMTPDRNFYISGRITWAENKISIHAVDAIHKLDTEIGPMRSRWSVRDLAGWVCVLMEKAGIDISPIVPLYADISVDDITDYTSSCILFPRGSIRDIIASLNHLMKLDNLPSQAFDPLADGSETGRACWPTYVDGGWPSFTMRKPTAKWDIYEEDCGENKKSVETQINRIDVSHQEAKESPSVYIESGSVEWVKNQASFIRIDGIVSWVTYALSGYDYPVLNTLGVITNKLFPVLPTNVDGNYRSHTVNIYGTYRAYSKNGIIARIRGPFILPLIDDETQQSTIPSQTDNWIYTQIVPWNKSTPDSQFYYKTQAAAWAGLVKQGVIDKDAASMQVGVYSKPYILSDVARKYTVKRFGKTITLDTYMPGRIYIKWTTGAKEAYPEMAVKSILDRSTITGSFTWKGDPRMQPRDVVNFHRLDGTVEEITLENITLHHEGGGTYADITYRKGVC